jgi:hypothetical protein
MAKAGRGSSLGLAFYVTSHGFGHMSRAVAVVNRVPRDVPVTIKSDVNLFPHWRERLTRPAELESYTSDAGAVNPPGDSAATDGRATLERAIRVHKHAMAGLEEEVERLKTGRIGAILCDAPAVPLVAASRAGVPGFLMANFTWVDIYAPHAKALGGDAVRLVGELREAYRHATAVFRIEPALRMSWLKPIIDMGMVVNRAKDRRGELRKLLGVEKKEKLVYLYVGRYGQADLEWGRLDQFAKDGVRFVGYHAAPAGAVANLDVIPGADWPGGDLIKSCDAVVAKAGYGTVSEAMANRTPIIYPPRQGFAEHRVLDRAMRQWGGGVAVSARAFRDFRLGPALRCALAMKPEPPPWPADGAARIVEYLLRAGTVPI